MAGEQQSIEERACAFHLFDPDIQEHPHELLDQFREQCPVAHSDQFGGFWFLTRYEDVRRVYSEWESFSSVQVTVPDVQLDDAKQIPLGFDPPELNRYRQMFAPLFSPTVAARIEGSARELARGLIDPIAARGHCDFVADFAVPLPSQVFLALLGVPVDDLEFLLDLKEKIIRDGLSGDPAKAAYARDVARPTMDRYFADHLDARAAMADPPDDLLTGYLRARDDDGRTLTRDEILRAISLLTTAGLDTVTNVLALSWSTLAERPDLQQMIVDDPLIIPTAVEEFLRYWSVVNGGRVATRDVDIGGCQIKAGEFVMTMTSAAGRDPAQFERPHEIDLRRNPNRHIAFGAGPHRCLGSHIARMQLRVAFEEWHRSIPVYSLAPGTTPSRHFGVLMGATKVDLVVGRDDRSVSV